MFPGLVTTLVQRFAGLPVRRVGFEALGRLRLEIDGDVADVLVTEPGGHGHHDGVDPHLGLEQFQLLRNVDGALAGQARPIGSRAVAVGAMASGADRGF